MSYYPTINYLAASESIVNHLSDLPRVDREREDRDMKRRLYDAQIANYELGAKRYEREERDYQEDREIGKKILGLYEANRADYSPSITRSEVPDEATANEFYPGGRIESIYTPPKRSLYGDASQALMGSGKWKQAMAMMEAEDKIKRERTDNLIDAMGKITKAYEVAPSLGKNLHKIFAESFPELKNQDFVVNEEGKVDKGVVRNPITGKVEGFFPIVGGKPHGAMIPIEKKEDAPKDREEADRRVAAAIASGDPQAIAKAKRDADSFWNTYEKQKRIDAKYKESGEGKEKPLFSPKDAFNKTRQITNSLDILDKSGPLDPVAAAGTGNQTIISFAGKTIPEEDKPAIKARLLSELEEVAQYGTPETKARAAETINIHKGKMSKFMAEKSTIEDPYVQKGAVFIRGKEKQNSVKEMAANMDKMAKEGWSEKKIEMAFRASGSPASMEAINKLRKTKLLDAKTADSYLTKYKNRKEAEAAARRDGYTW